MMEKLANDPAFWLALGAVFGLIKVWADAKKAEIAARSSKDTVKVVARGQGQQQQTLVQHTAAIAALQATTAAQTPSAPPPLPGLPSSGTNPAALPQGATWPPGQEQDSPPAGG